MQKRAVAAMCALVSTVLLGSLGGKAEANLNFGLVGYYSFDGDALDHSGNAYHGIVHGATLAEDRFGLAARAYAFDGVDDYIGLSSNFSGLSQFTLCAWVRCETASGSLVQTSNGSVGASPAGFGLELFADRNGGASSDAATRYTYPTAADPSEDVWIHLAYLGFSDNMAQLYINGEQVSVGPRGSDSGVTGDYNYGVIGARVGTLVGGPYGFFDGLVDDVRIYNRTLTESEIEELASDTAVSEVANPLVVALGMAGCLLVVRGGTSRLLSRRTGCCPA